MTEDVFAAVDRFNDAFNRHDIDATMAAMTEDCVFESTDPPDGRRYTGQAEVRAVFEHFFAANPDARFDAEEIVVAGDRCTVLWRYRWGDGNVRGVDVVRIKDGKVAEKFAYVKG